MYQNEGLAILGTVHGAGVAFLLNQHKATRGRKRIAEVAVWSSNGPFPFDADCKDNWLNLRFKIVDV